MECMKAWMSQWLLQSHGKFSDFWLMFAYKQTPSKIFQEKILCLHMNIYSNIIKLKLYIYMNVGIWLDVQH